MTTVAFDGKVFASDTRLSSSFIHQDTVCKIRVVDTGQDTLIISGAGDYSVMLQFFDYVIGGYQNPPTMSIGDEFIGLVYSVKEKKLYLYDDKIVPMEISYPFAIGSGSSFAMGALLSGASAIGAVEVAMRLDAGTGGEIYYVDLETLNGDTIEPKPKKRKKK